MTLSSTNELDLIVKPASPEQVVATWRRTHVVWGKKLTLEKYLEREQVLSHAAFTGPNLTVYVLVPRSQPDTLDMLAHCDVFKRPCLVYSVPATNAPSEKLDNGSSTESEALPSGTPSNRPTQGDAYSIASVFCPHKYRGRGYASLMMKLVYQHLQSQPNALVSTLYSDVGPKFYARQGWDTYRAFHYEIKVPSSPASTEEIGDRVEWLTSNNVDELVQQDCRQLSDKVQALALGTNPVTSPSPGGRYLLILPNNATMEWHWLRAQFVGPALGYTQPERFGCKITAPTGTLSVPSFILWIHDFVTKELHVLRTHWNHEHDQKLLLTAAVEEARQCGLGKVIVWKVDHPSLFVSEGPRIIPEELPVEWKVKEVERIDSLPAVAWFASEEHQSEGPLTWLCNDRYGWV
ncbi:hypothetical protein IWQ62_004510 [Dispira parvispora]|uniref:LYC1 C-terminal domain-containing protein n=1 Tax=Dispira parvispora TaxID=1520584 RepID=A0A9W8APP1_9FUNG|nr:hypothetical protein IWQ62_004510 [Dispira parvispora]